MKLAARKRGETPRHGGERALSRPFLRQGGHGEKGEVETRLRVPDCEKVFESGGKRASRRQRGSLIR